MALHPGEFLMERVLLPSGISTRRAATLLGIPTSRWALSFPARSRLPHRSRMLWRASFAAARSGGSTYSTAGTTLRKWRLDSGPGCLGAVSLAMILT